MTKRVFIDAIRTIQPGEELVYDYQITRDPDDPDDVDEVFACRCGAAGCRGSMLEPKKPPRKKKTGKQSARRGKSEPRRNSKSRKRASAARARRPARQSRRARR